MVVSGKRAEPKGAQVRVQGPYARSLVPALGLLLSGCSTLSSINPINWWHELEGGKIAEQRPPPPGANDPDPSLSGVPARPAPPDRDAMKRLTQGLIADRENARYTAAAAPLPDPSSPGASPGLFGTGTLPPPGRSASTATPAPAGVASASLQAASAPVEPAPPASAPVKPVRSAPLAAPEVPATIPATELPPVPTEPPPRPAAAPPPVPPKVAAVPIAPAPVPAGNDAVALSFDPGSAVLTALTAEAVKQAAATRKGRTIAVIGYGDGVASDPSAQATALRLAIARARTVADALKIAGVPAEAVQIGGEAAGRGVSLRLLQ